MRYWLVLFVCVFICIALPLLFRIFSILFYQVSRYYIRRCEHPIVRQTSGTKGNQVWSSARTALVESIWEQTELAHEDHARAKVSTDKRHKIPTSTHPERISLYDCVPMLFFQRGQRLMYDRESVARLLAASPYTTRLRVGYLASHFRQEHPIGVYFVPAQLVRC